MGKSKKKVIEHSKESLKVLGIEIILDHIIVDEKKQVGPIIPLLTKSNVAL